MTTSDPTPSFPYATLLGFTRFVNRSGPARANFVGGLRKQRESGRGLNPHSQFVKALKADIRFRTGGTHVTEVVQTVNRRYQRLYAALSEGAIRYLGTLGEPGEVTLLPVHDALGMVGGLPVKIAAHFGLGAESRKECVRLHFDEEPPTPETTTVMLHLMASYMDEILPGAEPVLLDLRRGELHRSAEIPGNPAQIDRWVTGEAAGFAAMWRAA